MASMDSGVFHCCDLLISAALGISKVRVVDVFTYRQDISFPFDPGSNGNAGLGWMQ